MALETIKINFKGMQRQLQSFLNEVDGVIVDRKETWLNPQYRPSKEARSLEEIDISDLEDDEKDEILQKLKDIIPLLLGFTVLIEE